MGTHLPVQSKEERKEISCRSGMKSYGTHRLIFRFSTSEGICLCDSSNHSISPRILQKLSVPFTGGSTKEHGKKFLKFLTLVKDIPQTCKGEIDVSTQRKIKDMNEVV